MCWLKACSSARITCRQTSRARQASKKHRNCKLRTQKSSVCARMYPAETKEMQYQIKKKSMYWYVLNTYQYIPFYELEPEVCTRCILLTSSMYFKTYISYQYVLVYTRYILGTYLRKKVSRYILGVKSMYRVHTGSSLCWFITVPYYSMVHTGSYSVHTSMTRNSVHTIGHDSRCRFCLSWVIILKIPILEGSTARELLLIFNILCKKSNTVYPDSVKWTRNPDSTKNVRSVLMSISSNEQTTIFEVPNKLISQSFK